MGPESGSGSGLGIGLGSGSGSGSGLWLGLGLGLGLRVVERDLVRLHALLHRSADVAQAHVDARGGDAHIGRLSE